MTLKEKIIKRFVKDDLFFPVSARKIYQISSVCFSEFLGTFFVMLLGCSGWLEIVTGLGISKAYLPSLFNIALGWAGSYGAMYVCMAHISGYFLNPAMTVAMVIIGEMSLYRMLLYIVFEIGGAITGVMVIKLIVGSSVSADFCLAKPDNELPMYSGILVESWGTFIWALTFCSCYDIRTKTSFDLGPFKIFVALFGLNLGLIRFTGCSLNPARAIAAAIAANDYDNMVIYVVSPFIGAMLGAGLYILCFNSSIVDPPDTPPPPPPPPPQ